MRSLVSLITPCYNGEKFIDNYISNILRQSYHMVEVIFVNDGSTDRSEELILKNAYKFEKKNYTFVYCAQENKGVAHAVNHALKLITGEFIMLLDMDDILYPEAIKAKAEFLMQNRDYGMVRNNGYYIFEQYPYRKWKFEATKRMSRENKIFEDLLLVRTNNWPGSYMVRSEHLFSIYPDRNIYISKYGQNLQFMIPVSYYYKTGFINQCLMEYYIRDESLSHSGDLSKILDMINGYERNRKEIVNQMNITIKEKELYLKGIERKYLRDRLGFSIRGNNRELFQQQYLLLKQNEWLTLRERCLNFLFRLRYFSLLYRLYCHFIFINKKKVI